MVQIGVDVVADVLGLVNCSWLIVDSDLFREWWDLPRHAGVVPPLPGLARGRRGLSRLWRDVVADV